ncbi:MAG TPA: hypothetical protein DEH78_05195 [Solibacterales bacterium]|nr:hypothetical protein [Bryobacterales bacterium]
MLYLTKRVGDWFEVGDRLAFRIAATQPRRVSLAVSGETPGGETLRWITVGAMPSFFYAAHRGGRFAVAVHVEKMSGGVIRIGVDCDPCVPIRHDAAPRNSAATER